MSKFNFLLYSLPAMSSCNIDDETISRGTPRGIVIAATKIVNAITTLVGYVDTSDILSTIRLVRPRTSG